MPNTKSAAKRLRQDKALNIKNRAVKSEVKTYMKRVISAAEAGDIEKAEAEFRMAAKKLDKASAKNIIHKNTASRQKSRLQRIIKSQKQSSE